MQVREYRAGDLDSLRRIHARQAFDYPFPNLSDPLFLSKLVVEDDSGSVVAACLARLTCEMYLLLDPDAGSAENRFAALAGLHEAGEQDLVARGLEDAHAWLPPRVARRFGRRLENFGWVRDDGWTPYCRKL
jgi:hypothetical protein